MKNIPMAPTPAVPAATMPEIPPAIIESIRSAANLFQKPAYPAVRTGGLAGTVMSEFPHV